MFRTHGSAGDDGKIVRSVKVCGHLEESFRTNLEKIGKEAWCGE